MVGGQRVGGGLEHVAGKLQAAPDPDTSLVASWHRGATREDGRGAGPDRMPAATWDHDGRSRLLRLHADHVLTSSVVLSAGYGELDRRLEDLPRGGLGGDVFTNRSGVTGGTAFAVGEEFLRFDDPTDAAGSGDDDGDRAVDLAPRDALGTAERAIDSSWSFHWSAGVELQRDFDLGFALDGREGYPLPYLRHVARERAGIAAVELTDRADSVRAPDLVTLDARLAKELTFGDFNVSFALEAFNLFGAGDVLRRELDLGVGRGGAADETLTPRVWRIGARLGWR